MKVNITLLTISTCAGRARRCTSPVGGAGVPSLVDMGGREWPGSSSEASGTGVPFQTAAAPRRDVPARLADGLGFESTPVRWFGPEPLGRRTGPVVPPLPRRAARDSATQSCIMRDEGRVGNGAWVSPPPSGVALLSDTIGWLRIADRGI